ncbi:MAG TPA: NAD(P)H-dependent glycerol-3-phosphate dehydrogenase [Rhizobacter sp.]|nr:NAD(P)H-dependent glycerol-3-phosphate dehydrogenase [Rhizobacter sp.]
MNVTVLGAGAWGTALAIHIARRHATQLWTRDPLQCDSMRRLRENARYLPGIALPEGLQLSTDFDAAVAHACAQGLVIVATPMAALAEMLRRLPASAPGVLWVCKGFQEGSGLLGHEVAQAVCPGNPRVGVLSGPSFAVEVARGQPAALVVASTDESTCQLAVDCVHGESLRIYASSDPIGVEVGGAVKNVMAIATGIADGMPGRHGVAAGLGLNARAALITRGLAEMTRLGVALGARPETFMGLSGLGDLVLTATGDLSRNRRVGLMLAQGRPLAQILHALGHVAEGVACAATVLQRARTLGLDMPITEAVVRVLEGSLTPVQAIQELMSRDARRET